MKKLIALFLSLLLILPVVTLAADLPDLDGLSFDELVTLREKINLAIWNCQEWQEVSVPAGTYVVGQDIPAGHWSIRVAAEQDILNVSYFDMIDEIGKGPARGCNHIIETIASPGFSAFGDINAETFDIDAKEGWYIKVTKAVIFSPFTGKPDLGFK